MLCHVVCQTLGFSLILGSISVLGTCMMELNWRGRPQDIIIHVFLVNVIAVSYSFDPRLSLTIPPFNIAVAVSSVSTTNM